MKFLLFIPILAVAGCVTASPVATTEPRFRSKACYKNICVDASYMKGLENVRSVRAK